MQSFLIRANFAQQITTHYRNNLIVKKKYFSTEESSKNQASLQKNQTIDSPNLFFRTHAQSKRLSHFTLTAEQKEQAIMLRKTDPIQNSISKISKKMNIPIQALRATFTGTGVGFNNKMLDQKKQVATKELAELKKTTEKKIIFYAWLEAQKQVELQRLLKKKEEGLGVYNELRTKAEEERKKRTEKMTKPPQKDVRFKK